MRRYRRSTRQHILYTALQYNVDIVVHYRVKIVTKIRVISRNCQLKFRTKALS